MRRRRARAGAQTSSSARVPHAVALAMVFLAGSARAQDPLPSEQPRPTPSPYLLSGDRVLEVNAGTALQLDWNGLAGISGPTAHAGVVAGGEIGVPFFEQRLRPALFTGVKLGGFADEVHGPFAFAEGIRLRVSPWMWDVFDVYVVLRADVDLQPDAGAVFRPGAGLGLRAARLIAVEASWDFSFPIDSRFTGTQHPDFVPYGVTFGVLFDACFHCNRTAPTQVHRDLACRLYQAAAAPTSAHGEICNAVQRALSARPNPESASRLDDGTKTFLERLSVEVTSDEAKRAVNGLAQLHGTLTHDWASYEARAIAAEQRDRQLAERWTYAPVPADLRAYLGCDKDELTQRELPPPTCQEVTN